MDKITQIRQEIERRKKARLDACEESWSNRNKDALYFKNQEDNELLLFLDTLEQQDKLLYCIEYINPRFPRINGKLNVRHLRITEEHLAEVIISVILSFGGKIYALYRGNLKEGKLADWETPMVVEDGDWYTDEWLQDIFDCGHNC